MRRCAPSKERRMQISPTGLPAISSSGVSNAGILGHAVADQLGCALAPAEAARTTASVARGFSVEAITAAGRQEQEFAAGGRS